MHEISAAVQELIKILRGTDMPWIADEIETQLRQGRMELSRRGVDDAPANVERRQQDFVGDMTEGPGETAGEPGMQDDESYAFSSNRQIKEAINILRAQIEGRVELVDAAIGKLSDEFGLSNLEIIITDEAGQSQPVLSASARDAAEELKRRVAEIERWLANGAKPDTGA